MSAYEEHQESPEQDPALRRAEAAATLETPDPEHSRHVAVLALSLFDQLREPLDLPAEGRELLAAAALWHDVGQRIRLADHHRLSYEVIRDSVAREFTPEERLAIANIARYHRGAAPSLEHTGYRSLPRRLRPLVDQMAALLRIAEALDASHLQVVREIRCTVGPDAVTVRVRAREYPMMEVERAHARSGLFRDVFQRDIVFIPEIRTGEPDAPPTA
ncbi:HD domain-containing protein [Sphaerobacter thermophilus]|uniref:HD domain-containing protein n=1 Tax=Sphaerobacter thermophilus TaxID=2057 RepID=UPI0039C3ED99